MYYIRIFGIVFFLIIQNGFSTDFYTFKVKDIYSFTMRDTPLVSVITQEYIEKINEHPFFVSPPTSNAIKIIENFFTLWKYSRYKSDSSVYDSITVFRYDNKDNKISYFFYLNILIQLDFKNNSFTKVSYLSQTNKIVFERGQFETQDVSKMSKNVDTKPEVVKASETVDLEN